MFGDDKGDPLPAPLAGYVTIGNNQARREVAERLGATGKLFGPVLVHPKAVVCLSIFGHGTVVMAGAVVQANTRVGKHAIINTNASVDHDCEIGDYAHIAPGAVLCGGVKVGEGALIGAGAVIVPGVKVGKWRLVKAGTVVKEDVPDAEVASVNS